MKLLCAVLGVNLMLWGTAIAAELTIEIDKVANNNGHLVAVVFAEEHCELFPVKHDKADRRITVPAGQGRQSITIDNLSDGRYAIVVFHDINDNGVLDHGSLGLPKEGFGFSNHPTLLFGAPSFKASAITVSSEHDRTDIEMKYW